MPWTVELFCWNLFLFPSFQLNGSLVVKAENVIGSMKINESGESILHYGLRYYANCINRNHRDPVSTWSGLQIQAFGLDCMHQTFLYVYLVIVLGVEGANCKMSRYWTKELIGLMMKTYTGNTKCSSLRCWRSYCMEMLNLRQLMLSFRLSLNSDFILSL